MSFNITFVCTSSHTSSADRPISAFAGKPIMPNSLVLMAKSVGMNDAANAWYSKIRELGHTVRHSVALCGDAPIIGFTLYDDDPRPIIQYLADSSDAIPCGNWGVSVVFSKTFYAACSPWVYPAFHTLCSVYSRILLLGTCLCSLSSMTLSSTHLTTYKKSRLYQT